jgi:hypothetical protein
MLVIPLPINVHKGGFGSYIDYRVLNKKIDKYNSKGMGPPKLVHLWEPKIQVTVGKVT